MQVYSHPPSNDSACLRQALLFPTPFVRAVQPSCRRDAHDEFIPHASADGKARRSRRRIGIPMQSDFDSKLGGLKSPYYAASSGSHAAAAAAGLSVAARRRRSRRRRPVITVMTFDCWSRDHRDDDCRRGRYLNGSCDKDA